MFGPTPDVQGRFGESSFSGNPGLCGTPLLNACPPDPQSKEKQKHQFSLNRFLIYSGYVILGLIIILLVAFKLFHKTKRKEEDSCKELKSGMAGDDRNSSSNNRSNCTSNSSVIRTRGNRSEYSLTSAKSGVVSSSLVVLNGQLVNQELRFKDLLRAPAEMLGRGKHGSLYKVMLSDRLVLVVKRVREWIISKEEFRNRMEKIDRAKHPSTLPPVAYYCSWQEKLLVYEYRSRGSLFALLHGKLALVLFS